MHRVLGGTRLRVSVISFGVYSLSGMYGHVDHDRALSLLRYAYELGVNFYDTGDVYGRGVAESIVKEALYEYYDDIVIATKVGYDFYTSNPPRRRYDEGYLVKAVRMSVERLGKKPIDLLQIHNPPLSELKRDSIYRVARLLKEDGLISHFGIALGPEVDVYDEAMEAISHDEVEVIQLVFNMLEQEPGYTIIREARKHGVGVITRVPHAGGVLDESITEEEVKELSDHRSLRRKGWFTWAFNTYRQMKDILDKYKGTPGQKALRFIYQTVNPDSIVVIAKDQERLREYIGFLNADAISPADIETLRRIYYENIMYSPEAPSTIRT
ncbi:MAG: aldo/keto reductase [Desulfurococcales archaeon]|nr:aldo/keto reductase [Desulfurococcales archaeon]